MTKMLDKLDQTLAEAKENFLGQICDLCHWPYVEKDQEKMDEICYCCEVSSKLDALMELQRSVTAGRTMQLIIEDACRKN